MLVTGKIYPNGEFGIARVKKFDPESLPEKGDRRKAELVHEYVKEIGIEAVLEAERNKGTAVPLGLSMLPNSRNRAKRGSKGITREAARNVRNAAYLIEERHPRKVLSFVTLTLPSLSPEEFELISAQWSIVVQRLVDRLRRDLVAAGCPGEILGVTEIQEQRLTEFGQFAPHLHLLFVGRRIGRTWAVSTKRIDSIWHDVLSNRLNRAVSTSSACNMQTPRGSIARYLAKYMSKGVKILKTSGTTKSGTILPSAWHTMSRTLLQRIKKRIVSESDIIHALWDDCWSEVHALCAFRGFVEIKVSDGWVYICGAYGRVTNEFLEWLKSDRHENFCRLY